MSTVLPTLPFVWTFRRLGSTPTTHSGQCSFHRDKREDVQLAPYCGSFPVVHMSNLKTCVHVGTLGVCLVLHLVRSWVFKGARGRVSLGGWGPVGTGLNVTSRVGR